VKFFKSYFRMLAEDDFPVKRRFDGKDLKDGKILVGKIKWKRFRAGGRYNSAAIYLLL